VDKSKKEIDRAISLGINLIGELVPYHYSWRYSDEGFSEILDYAEGKGLVFSLHTNFDEIDTMGKLAKEHPGITFVFAHPGEILQIKKHIEIMKDTPNVYLDLSGTGLFRYGMLKRLVLEVGADRILFGTDYPICNPGMYVGGVDYEDISEEEKDLIFSKNAKRILGIN
jgi:predicted TIM-barrel fold metal-dependent hydrolase